LLGIHFLIIINDWPVISFQHEPIFSFDMAGIHHPNIEKGHLLWDNREGIVIAIFSVFHLFL